MFSRGIRTPQDKMQGTLGGNRHSAIPLEPPAGASDRDIMVWAKGVVASIEASSEYGVPRGLPPHLAHKLVNRALDQANDAMNKGECARAEEILTSPGLLRGGIHDHMVLMGIGAAQIGQGKFKEGIATLGKSLRPNLPAEDLCCIYYNLAIAQHYLGNHQEARVAVDEALKYGASEDRELQNLSNRIGWLPNG